MGSVDPEVLESEISKVLETGVENVYWCWDYASPLAVTVQIPDPIGSSPAP